MSATGRSVAVLAAEVVDHSSAIGEVAESVLERLEGHRRQFMYPKIAEYSGRVVRATGPSLLVEFASPTEAVRCAVDVQRGMIDRNLGTPPDQCTAFRIGVTIGEVTATGEDFIGRAVAALPTDRLATLIKPGAEFYGESANLAMRIARLAEPGGICVSANVRDAVRDRLLFEDIGQQNLDIPAAAVRCYTISARSIAARTRLATQNRRGFASRHIGLRGAAVAATVLAMVGIWAVAFWGWLDAGSSTAPSAALTTAAAPVTSGGSPADSGTQALSVAPSPPVSAATAEMLPAAPAEPQPVSLGIMAAAPQPSPEIGAAVVRGNQAPSAVQITPGNGLTVVRGRQTPSTLQSGPDSGTTVVRGNQAQSTPQITPDGGTAVVRGNQTPATPQATPERGTAVVRGKQASSALQGTPDGAGDAGGV